VMFDYKINSPESSFSIDPHFDRLGLRVTTELKFLRANGAQRAFDYVGLPGLIRLDPSWSDAAGKFVQMGFFRLLDSTEALLFLFCLAIPFRRGAGLAGAAAVFAVASTVTFVASTAFNMAPTTLWFPPFVSLVLAVAVFYLAIENILGAKPERRWAAALVFGLAFGFAFASSLQSVLQFAGSHPDISIGAYTIGIDAAIAAVMLLIAPGLALLFRYVAEERMGAIVLSAIVAHTAWHWMVTRYADWRRYPLRMPPLDLMLLATVLRWAMVGVVLAAVVWVMRMRRVRVNGGTGTYGGSRLPPPASPFPVDRELRS